MAEEIRDLQLDNGLRVIVLPFGEAPVVAFHVHVQVGAIDEPLGQSGLAHFAEHMAFKGSAHFGSRYWPREREAMARADEAWGAYERALQSPPGEWEESDLEDLRDRFLALDRRAVALGDPGSFDRAVEMVGGLNQNAATDVDSTDYWVTLPSNQVETWFWLARQQFGGPVMREFYAERDVVLGERREGPESNPREAGLDALVAAAFTAHPYRDPVLGHRQDLERLDRPEMLAFWRRHYTADRMVLAIVGRVDAEDVLDLAEQYLGDLPKGNLGRERRTQEPPPAGPRTLSLSWDSAPMALVGWRIPSLVGRSGWVHAALGDLLFEGASARVPDALLTRQRFVAQLDWGSGFPGSLDPNLMVALLLPRADATVETCVDSLQAVVNEFALQGPTPREMTGVRRRLEISFLQGIQGRAELAEALAWAVAEEPGGWLGFFQTVQVIRSLEAAEVQEASQALSVNRRVVAQVGPIPAEVKP